MQSMGWSSRRGVGSEPPGKLISSTRSVLNKVPDPEPDVIPPSHCCTGEQRPKPWHPGPLLPSAWHQFQNCLQLSSGASTAQQTFPGLLLCALSSLLSFLGPRIQTSDSAFSRTLQGDENCSEPKFPHLYNERVYLSGFQTGLTWNPRVTGHGSE